MIGAYYTILIVRIPGPPRRATMIAGNNAAGAHNVILNVGKNGECLRYHGKQQKRLHLCSLGAPSGSRVGDGHHSSDITHVKDLKNPIEVRFPGADRPFIFLRVQASRDHTPFTPLDYPPLNYCHGPTIESISVDGLRCMSLVQLTMSTDLSRHIRAD
jgi:hypothetical protein